MDKWKIKGGESFAGCLRAGDLEAAAEMIGPYPGRDERQDVERRIAGLAAQETRHRWAGEIRKANRLKRRRYALGVFRDHGLDLVRLLPPVRLPDGYAGKVLLVSVSGGAADGRVCLRGGDDWHREILADVREEVADLGLSRARVDEMGGCWLRFEGNASICLWGRSDEFGACDKVLAAELVRGAFPDRPVRVID